MNEIDQDIKVSKELDRQANDYDKSFTVNTYQRKAQIMVVEQLKIADGMTILDLGCGTGSGTIDIAKNLHDTGKVVGIDVSEKMIDQARGKKDIAKSSNVEFHIGSGHSLEYDDFFNYVICTNAYHHIKSKKRVFANGHIDLMN